MARGESRSAFSQASPGSKHSALTGVNPFRIALFAAAAALVGVVALQTSATSVEALAIVSLLALLGDSLRVRHTVIDVGFETAPIFATVLLEHELAFAVIPAFVGILASRGLAGLFRRQWRPEIISAPAQGALSYATGAWLYLSVSSSQRSSPGAMVGESLLLFGGYILMRLLFAFIERSLQRKADETTVLQQARLLGRSIVLLLPFVALQVLIEPVAHEAAAPGTFAAVLVLAYLMRNESEAERRSEWLRRRNRELSLIRLSQERLMSAESDEARITQLKILLSDLIPLRACVILAMDPGATRSPTVFRFGDCQQPDQTILRWLHSAGLLERPPREPVVRTGSERKLILCDEPGLAQVIIGLSTIEHVYGIAIFESADDAVHDRETTGLIQLLMNQAAVAMQDRILSEDLRVQKQELEQNSQTLVRILEVSQSLIVKVDVDVILKEVAEAIQTALGSEAVLISLAVDGGEFYIPRAHAGLEEVWEDIRHTRQAADSMNELLTREFAIGESYFIPYTRLWADDSLTFVRESADGFRLYDWNSLDMILVPLREHGGVIGYLAVREKTQGHPPSENKTHALEIFAKQVVAALQSARQYQEIQRLAQRDALTSAYNHRYFQEQLHREIQRHQRSTETFGLIMLDLDDFKRMNDTFGHPTGDEILKGVVAEVSGCVRDEIDVVCRYGGEEFAILLPSASADGAAEVANRVRTRVASRHFLANGDPTPLKVTVSCGVSVFPKDGQNATELIAKADAALYVAKHRGKNQVVSA